MGDKTTKLNHLLFMDDLKLFCKSKDQVDFLVNTMHLFSEDIGIEFGIKKCGILMLKSGGTRGTKSNRLKLPDGMVMNKIDKEGY